MLLIAACLNGVARSNAEAQGRAALHHWQDLHGDGYVRARACIACSDRPRLIGRSGRAAGIGRAAQEQGLGCSKQFMAALTEVAFKQLEATGRDLELFARCVPAPRCVPCNDVADDVLATPWSMQARETVDHYDGRRQAVHAPERSPCAFPKCRHIAAQSAAAAHGAVSPPVRVFFWDRTASWTGLQRRWRGPRTRRLPRPRRRGKARPRAKPRRCTPTTAARRTPTTMPGTLARSERHESHEAPRPRFPGVLDGALLGGALVSLGRCHMVLYSVCLVFRAIQAAAELFVELVQTVCRSALVEERDFGEDLLEKHLCVRVSKKRGPVPSERGSAHRVLGVCTPSGLVEVLRGRTGGWFVSWMSSRSDQCWRWAKSVKRIERTSSAGSRSCRPADCASRLRCSCDPRPTPSHATASASERGMDGAGPWMWSSTLVVPHGPTPHAQRAHSPAPVQRTCRRRGC